MIIPAKVLYRLRTFVREHDAPVTQNVKLTLTPVPVKYDQ